MVKIHLVDGTYELFRNYFGAPKRTNDDGHQVGALRGLLRSMLGLLHQDDVTHVGVAFDHVIESFRNDMFAGYKTGAGLPDELTSQFHPAEDLCRALGLVVWPLVEFEADDGIATVAARFSNHPDVDQVIICTPDKDMAQCVIGQRVTLWDRMRKKTYDEDGVREKFGVGPASIPDYLGLVGDDADGIPGIPRWGAKSTATVLRRYGHIEQIPDDVSEWDVKVRGAASLAENLASRREDAMLYRDLAILRTDAPTNESLEEMRWTGADLPALQELVDWLGDTRAMERLPQAP